MPINLAEWESYKPEEDIEDAEKKTREEIRQEQKEAIMKFITEKKITFPTEIKREVGLSKDRVYDLLWELLREGKIKRHYVPETPCYHFKMRMADFWAMGIKGIGTFKRIHWVVLAGDPCDGKDNIVYDLKELRKHGSKTNKKKGKERD
ncbi:hypothetical protein J7L13_03255 [bacterium]|nr:hypothetical protein [bacterium]